MYDFLSLILQWINLPFSLKILSKPELKSDVDFFMLVNLSHISQDGVHSF